MEPDTYPERSDKEIIKLGFRGRCPRCGIGRIYAKFLKVNDKCRNCGLVLSEHDAGDGAVVPALLILGSVIVGLALWVEFTHEPAVWVHVVLWGPISLGLTAWILPKLKGIGIALQHKHRSTEEATKPGGS
jgi:uncharacterized protein (DUF983 family)